MSEQTQAQETAQERKNRKARERRAQAKAEQAAQDATPDQAPAPGANGSDGTLPEGSNRVGEFPAAPPNQRAGVAMDNDEVRQAVHDACQTIIELKRQRAAINAQINATRKDVYRRGIRKVSFDFALKYLEMDDEQREDVDVSLAICRKAVKLPLQPDMFRAGAPTDPTKH